MRIIFDTQGRATGTATDDYTGPDAWAEAPEGFDPQYLADCTLAAGVVSIVPAAVERRQALHALLHVGKLEAIQAAIAAIPDPADRLSAQIEYEHPSWRRDNALLQSIWERMDGTAAELDALFVLARTL